MYCASSEKVHSQYFEATVVFAEQAVKSGYGIVYGGSSVGLMGRLADTVLQHKGSVVGIMPHFMQQVEWHHKELTRLILVEDMRERKKLLIETADAVVALPGGCGTLEELAETITLKRLGKFTKPIVILNLNGFYDSLELFLERMIAENFMSEKHRHIWTFVKTPEEIIPAIENAMPWSADAIHFAAV